MDHEDSASSFRNQQDERKPVEVNNYLAWLYRNYSNEEMADQIITNLTNFRHFEHDQHSQLQFGNVPQYFQEMLVQQLLFLKEQILYRTRMEAADRAMPPGNYHPNIPNWPDQNASTSYIPGQANENLDNRSQQNQDPSPFVNSTVQEYKHEPSAPVSDITSTFNSFQEGNIDDQNYIPPPPQDVQLPAPDMDYDSTSSSSQEADPPAPLPDTFSLEELKGNVHSMAKSPSEWSRLLQTYIEGGPEKRMLIVDETLEHLYELIVDHWGTGVVRLLIADPSRNHISRIVHFLIQNIGNMLHTCQNNYGSETILRLLDQNNSPEQVDRISSSLRPIAVPLITSYYGSSVIQKCFTRFRPEYMEGITNDIVDRCLDISIDINGCCVMQDCLQTAVGACRQRLLEKITAHVVELSKHAYGSYVVQHTIELRDKVTTRKIVKKLNGHYVNLSQDKYGNLVAETCILLGERDQVVKAIKEIMNNDTLLALVTNPFAKSIVQNSLQKLEKLDGQTFINVVDRIQSHIELQSHPDGKWVLELVEELKQQK